MKYYRHLLPCVYHISIENPAVLVRPVSTRHDLIQRIDSRDVIQGKYYQHPLYYRIYPIIGATHDRLTLCLQFVGDLRG